MLKSEKKGNIQRAFLDQDLIDEGEVNTWINENRIGNFLFQKNE